jgi:FixJ family two-component response regulator
MKANDGLRLRLVPNRAPFGPSTVYIVDDDDEMRRMLARFLEPLRVSIRDFDTADQFLERYDASEPGCLILDLRLPGMDGFSLYAALRGMRARLPVIFVTGYADVGTARRALIGGAADFLEKPVERRTLLAAVRAALALDAEQRKSMSACDRLTGLTLREWDVLRLVVEGKANKVISADLGISQKTVEAHRSRVMSKSGAKSVADLVRMFAAFERDGEPAWSPRS